MPVIFFDLMGVMFTNKEVIKHDFFQYTSFKTYEEVKAKYDLFSLGEIDEKEFLDGLGIKGNWKEKFFSVFHLNPEFTHAASYLMEKNALFGFTNFPQPWAEELNEKFELFHYLNGIITSGEVGARKPDEQMYEYACEQGVGECIFIDDEIANLDVAKKFGRTILYSKEQDIETSHEKISDLHALKQILKPSGDEHD